MAADSHQYNGLPPTIHDDCLLVEAFNATEVDFPSDRCVHELFEAQVVRTPEAVAVVFGEASLTYSELNVKANRLAHHLRSLGVAPDSRVAICAERMLEMVVGLLAVLKAGGAYVPMDPNYPIERLQHMLLDSDPVVLLTQRKLEDLFANLDLVIPAIYLDAEDPGWMNQPERNPDRVSANLMPNHLAYVIYTSGSTGMPKGVMIEHRSLCNQVTALQLKYNFTEEDRNLQFASFSFDVSVEEIFGTLGAGATLVLRTDAWIAAASQFWGLCEKHQVSTVNLPTLFWQQLAFESDVAVPSCVCRIIIGGDAVSTEAVNVWFKRTGYLPKLFNAYGPTETTVNATIHEARPDSLCLTSIGRPIANTKFYILDAHSRPLPIGVAGEMHIGGSCLARGYLNRPELTAERFVVDPFGTNPEARMYKTGDMGRWLPDGSIEFLGRNDFQVKVRGFRIELGEIEARLMEHPGVREAVVLAREDRPGEKRLVAYYTGIDRSAVASDQGGEDTLGADILRTHLTARLPDYMVPAAYVRMVSLPLMPNGKLDRKALLAPEAGAYAVREFEAPVGEFETALAGIWSDVLKLEKIGRHDNFFDLGGHSLLIVQIISRLRQTLHVEVALGDLFARPVLADFAKGLETAESTRLSSIARVSRDNPLMASFAQQRLWFLAQMEGVSGTYNLPSGLRLKGGIDRTALGQALDRIVARQEALRTTFFQIDGEPFQRIIPEEVSRFHLVEHDLRQHRDVEAELQRLIAEEVSAPFDLEQGPLIRGRLIREEEDEHTLLITMHHIVSDGWSMGVFVNELSALYCAYQGGQADPLPALSIQYADYAAWQRHELSGEILQQQTDYWKATLKEVPELLELPTDHARPAYQDHAGAFIEFKLDAELTQGLKALSKRHGTTLFMALLAGWAALLGRLSGQDDLVIGTPTANRGRREIEGLIGFFVNTLALRLDVSGSPTVGELLERVKTQALAAQQHQDIPFEQVVGIARPVRSLAYSPLFQVVFAWQNAPEGILELPGLTLAPLAEAPHGTAKFDLTLTLQEVDETIVGGLEYATALFDRSTVERYLGHLRILLKAMVTDDTQSIDRLPLMTESERHQVLVEWNDTQAEFPDDRCIHELFEAQVSRTPDAMAVVHRDKVITYAELNVRANHLAHYLRGLGTAPGERVVIMLERSTELIVAELAILKCGAAYVPIDLTFPGERRAFMIADSGARILLTIKGTELPDMPEVERVNLDELKQAEGLVDDLEVPLNSEATAYIMYTSGSTGQPKGVVIPHRAIGRLVLNNGYAEFNASDRVAFAANPAFDATTMEVWAPLLNGGCIVVIDHAALLDPKQFGQALKHHMVSILWLTVGLFNQYADELAGELAGLRYLIVGGDALDPKVISRVLRGNPPQHLINGYGPTETTTFAITQEITVVPEGARSIPIGRPISNTQVYILGAEGEPVPVGVAGEIHIGGAGVARGYLNRPELTEERFVMDPFSGETGARMYKTGDLGRWLPEGNIEFLGRNDFQVKIRGFRIELGEIAARLLEHPEVREAVVLAREDTPGDKRLVAYVTLRNNSGIEVSALREYLARQLPEYMVPSAFVQLSHLPLTSNGKLDRKALPAPDRQAVVKHVYEPPQGVIEQTLATIWSELLRIEMIGRNDHFFELGGHSLLAVRMLSRVQSALGVALPIAALFAQPTLSALAEAIDRSEERPLSSIAQVSRDNPLMASFAQQRLWFLAQMEGVSATYNMPFGFHLSGSLDRAALRRSLDRILARHEALRTVFELHEGQPLVTLLPTDCGFALIEKDLYRVPGAQQLLAQYCLEESHAPFDLSCGPLIRGHLIRLGPDEHVFLLTKHHIISDGWSMGVFIKELSALYRAFSSDQDDPLPALTIQYPDYAAWHRQWLKDNGLKDQVDYWRSQLAGVPVLLELPTAHSRPQQQSFAGATLDVAIDAELTRDLKRLSQQHGTTLFMILLAAWAAVLSRLSGQEDLVIGTASANRNRQELEPLIGFFVNTLGLRMDLSGQPSVAELLARVRQTVLAAQDHQDLPFEQVVEIVQPPRTLAHTPLFQVFFTWQNNDREDLDLPGLQVKHVVTPSDTAKFDLSLDLFETADGISGDFSYATALFDAPTIIRQRGYLLTLLRAMVADADQPVVRIDLLSVPERDLLLNSWNRTESSYPSDQCIHELFEEQVVRTPNTVAAVFAGQTLCYAELNASANRLAHKLRQYGVTADSRVAICVERSLEMVVGILGILKAGGAYVPMDPGYPAERLRHILADSAPIAVLTKDGLFQSLGILSDHAHGETMEEQLHLPEVMPIIDLGSHCEDQPEINPDPALVGLSPGNLAYVIYTSGSTGKPKGVMIEHHSLVNHMAWMQNVFPIAANDSVIQKTPVSFDASVWEFYAPILCGGRLVMAEPGLHRDPEGLAQLIQKEEIHTLQCVPTLMNMLLDAPSFEQCKQLRRVFCGGEALSLSLVERFHSVLPNAELINLYGPTEATIDATYWISPRVKNKRVVLGSPVTNTKAYILDASRQLVPIGVAGELYIGGEGVGRGYLNLPELTAERFLADPFSSKPGARIYQTGDMARWLSDGTIDFLGRNDFQVKIRGFRVELGEIEAGLLERAEILEASVMVREDAPGIKRLVAYFTSKNAINIDDLRSALSRRLPEHMVPAAFVRLEVLPLTPNGKLDRNALPAPNGQAVVTDAYEPPQGAIEQALTTIWSELLCMELIGRNDHFFKLGGHSLLAMQVVSRTNKNFSTRLSLGDFLMEPTIKQLAVAVEQHRWVLGFDAGMDKKSSTENSVAREEFIL